MGTQWEAECFRHQVLSSSQQILRISSTLRVLYSHRQEIPGKTGPCPWLCVAVELKYSLIINWDRVLGMQLNVVYFSISKMNVR